jgi:hypothetical protein
MDFDDWDGYDARYDYVVVVVLHLHQQLTQLLLAQCGHSMLTCHM